VRSRNKANHSKRRNCVSAEFGVTVKARVQGKINFCGVGPFKSLMAAGKKLFLIRSVGELSLFHLFLREESGRENVWGVRGPSIYWLLFQSSGKCGQSQWIGGWIAWWIGLQSQPFVVACGLRQSRRQTNLWNKKKKNVLCGTSAKVGEGRSWHAKFHLSLDKVEGLEGFLNYSVGLWGPEPFVGDLDSQKHKALDHFNFVPLI